MTNDKLNEPTLDYKYSLTPPSSSNPKRKNHATENVNPLQVEASLDNRIVRRRLSMETDFERFRTDAGLPSHIITNFTVYLPNKTSVDIQIDHETCQKLDVATFIDLLRKEQSTSKPHAMVKEKQRQIQWGPHIYLEDFEGNSIADGGFLPLNSRSPGILLLQDGHPDSVHSHPGFWNVTPEPQMLGVLPQDYTLFSALADELDNSLQAVSRLMKGRARFISVDLDHKNGKITIFDTGKGMDSTPENSIAKWGTIGSSNSRHSVSEAVGGKPPYLKPNFGMYGFGGIGAGLHLGGNITVSSKTENTRRVAVLRLEKEALQNDVKSGSVWKTAGAFRAPTEEELQLSPHGSFTKVEITNLNRKVSAWKVDEVRRKLKDYYFPYIQNDEEGRTARPVVIQVNSMDLAEVLGGEEAVTNSFSSVGDPYVLLLEFTHQAERADSGGEAEPGRSKPEKAHARITCFYFPIVKGKEAIEEVLEKLKTDDPEFAEERFETFSRRSIRRLGRLLPDARGKGLPFMEPKKGSKSKEANKQQFKRVKAFVDLDAGFVPTTSKMDLLSKHPFTEALLSLGLAPDSAKSPKGRRGGVTVVIKKERKVLAADRLHADYVKWVTDSHERFDEGATFDDKDSTIFFSTPDNKKDLGISSDVFRVLYTLKCRNISWKVDGSEPVPVRLKFMKGFPGLNNDNQLFFTVESFISEGMADSPGETKIICRPLGVPPEQGSKATDGEELPSFTLGKSCAFPLDALFSDKYEKIDEVAWEKQEEKIRNKSPGFVELLNEHEVLKFDVEGTLVNNSTVQAGSKLPKELIAVVRPKNFKQSLAESTGSSKCTPISRIEQRFIIQDPLEMRLTVKHMDSRHPGSSISGEHVEKGKEVFIATKKPLQRNNVKGLYSFGADNTLESLMTKMGTYLFTFDLVSEVYSNVYPTSIQITVLASDVAERWMLCTHEGSCAQFHKGKKVPPLKTRLGEVLETSLFLTQFDKFDNSIMFSSIPSEIHAELWSPDGHPLEISTTMSKGAHLSEDCFSLQLPEIEFSGGYIAPLLPSYHTVLRILISKKFVAGLNVKVLPGGVASTALKENEARDKWLRPGQIIENIVFQVFDKYGNLVEKGEEVKLVLDGLLVTDGKQGAIRKVDENGCVDLCGRLKVTAPYGNTASIVLQSTAGRCLGETPFVIVSRIMRIQNEPRSIPAGSQLKGIMVVVVDEFGEMDEEVDGPSYTLTLEWDRNIMVPFRHGKCTLPMIDLPYTPGLWKRKVELTQSPDLHTHISVELSEAEPPPQTMAEDTYAYLKSIKTLKCLVPYEPDDLVPSDPNSFSSSPNASPKCLVPFQRDGLVPPEFGNNSDSMTTLLNSSIEKIKKLQDKAQRQGRKAKAIEDQIAEAKRIQASTEHSMSQYKGQLRVLESNLKLKDCVKHDGNPWQGEQDVEYTSKEVLADIRKLGVPPGSHAAYVLLTAATEDRDYKAGPGKDIIGVVATLASVETNSLSKTLAQYLGLERMLSIVCKRKGAEDFLECYTEAGEVDDSKGLHRFAKTQKLKISGHFRAIVLNEASFYKGLNGMPAVNNDHPQKLLNITSAAEKGLQDPEGFLGYAVNLLHLNEFQLKRRVYDKYGLRESLFFHLFSFLQVYDTRRNMTCATEYVRTGAVSLDGGIIPDKNHLEFRFGWSDPIVQFAVEPQTTPSSQSRDLQSLRMQRSEIKMKIESLRQQSVNDLPRLEEMFRKARNKVDLITREVENEAKTGQRLAQTVHSLGSNTKREPI